MVQDLITRKKETLHVTQIQKYDGLTDGEKVPEEVLDLSNQTAAKNKFVDKIVNIDRNAEEIRFKVQWDGLPDE